MLLCHAFLFFYIFIIMDLVLNKAITDVWFMHATIYSSLFHFITDTGGGMPAILYIINLLILCRQPGVLCFCFGARTLVFVGCFAILFACDWRASSTL